MVYRTHVTRNGKDVVGAKGHSARHQRSWKKFGCLRL